MKLLTAFFGYKEESPIVEVKRNDVSDRIRIEQQALAERSLTETILKKGDSRFKSSNISISPLSDRQSNWEKNAHNEKLSAHEVRALIKSFESSLSVHQNSHLIYCGNVIDQIKVERLNGWPDNYRLSYRIQSHSIYVKIDVENDIPYYRVDDRYKSNQFNNICDFNYKQDFRNIFQYTQDILNKGTWVENDNVSKVWDDSDIIRTSVIPKPTKRWDDSDIIRTSVIPYPIITRRKAFKKNLDFYVGDNEWVWLEPKSDPFIDDFTSFYYNRRNITEYQKVLYNSYRKTIYTNNSKFKHISNNIEISLDLWLDDIEKNNICLDNISIKYVDTDFNIEEYKAAIEEQVKNAIDGSINRLIDCKNFVMDVLKLEKHHSELIRNNKNNLIMAINDYETFMTFCEVFDISVIYSELLIKNAIKCIGLDKYQHSDT